MAVTLHKYVNELIEEIGNLTTSAKAHRAYQLAIYLPALIEHFELDDEIDLSFIDVLFDDPIDEATEFIAKVPDLSKDTSRIEKKSQTMPNKARAMASTKRAPYTEEQKARKAEKMRQYRAEKKAAKDTTK